MFPLPSDAILPGARFLTIIGRASHAVPYVEFPVRHDRHGLGGQQLMISNPTGHVCHDESDGRKGILSEGGQCCAGATRAARLEPLDKFSLLPTSREDLKP